jgi:hypothetical protein
MFEAFIVIAPVIIVTKVYKKYFLKYGRTDDSKPYL